MKKQWIMLFISCGLLACAADGMKEPSAGDEPRQSGSDCIFEGTIRDYRVLDDSNLIVTASPKKNYHLELGRPAFGLNSAWRIAFTSSTNRICPGFSSIVFSGSMQPESIRIQSIRAVDEAEIENLLVRYGKKQPEEIKIPPAEDIEGAEVEELD
ncbi:MAG TPA: DUF6491 family protein [Woeseiaceae bacterium]|nr:DUF6491 family protein [Woeseiaceae bacterium]